MSRIFAQLPKSALFFLAAAALLVTGQAHAGKPKKGGATKPTATQPTATPASAPSASTAKPSVAKLTPKPQASLSKTRERVAKPVSDLMLYSAPPPMSEAQLVEATDMQIKDLNWAYLTPNKMSRHDRAALIFMRSEYISGKGNRAAFVKKCGTRLAGSPPCHEGSVGIGIQAAGPGLFVVNCTVRGGGDTPGKWIVHSGNAEIQIDSTVGQPDQVVFVVQATEAGAYSTRLSGTQRSWVFYGCSINTAS